MTVSRGSGAEAGAGEESSARAGGGASAVGAAVPFGPAGLARGVLDFLVGAAAPAAGSESFLERDPLLLALGGRLGGLVVCCGAAVFSEDDAVTSATTSGAKETEAIASIFAGTPMLEGEKGWLIVGGLWNFPVLGANF